MMGPFKDVKRLVLKMRLILWNHNQVQIPKKLLKLVRPNHPNNCLTLDLHEMKNINLRKIKQLGIYFRNRTEVKISVEDRQAMVKRTLKFDKFDNWGREISLSRNTSSIVKYFAVKFHQDVFVEDDKSRSCQIYPTEKYETYDECDSDFVLKKLRALFPANFTPIWAVDDINQVTQWIFLDEKRYKRKMVAYSDLLLGRTVSDCCLPCTKTAIKTVANEEKRVVFNWSKIAIDFTRKVTVSKHEFPKFNAINFVSAIGGSMGFWLGLGVIQTLELLMKIGCFGKLKCQHT